METALGLQLEEMPGNFEDARTSSTFGTSLFTRTWEMLVEAAIEKKLTGRINARVNQDVILLTASKGTGVISVVFQQEKAGVAKPEAGDRGAIASFLDTVCLLAQSDQPRKAAAEIMSYVDNLLRKKQFNKCKLLLDSVEVSRLKAYPTTLLAFLGITLAAKEQLSHHRQRLYARVQGALATDLGADRANRILNRFQ